MAPSNPTIEPLTEADESALRALLQRDPFYNLFMIGDLDTMGWGIDDLRFWGSFTPDGTLAGAAMRYRVNWCFYTVRPGESEAFAGLVDGYAESRVINGHPDQVDPVLARLERYQVQESHASYYCRLPLETTLPAPAWPTRRATVDDVEALAELYASAGRMRRGADALLRTLEMGRIFVTLDQGRIFSAALTTVETRSAAMIGGVFTPERWRDRGYASAAMTHLCTDLLAEGRQPCLFYDNPAAGTIYRRLGFLDIGPWHLVFLTPISAERTQKS